MKCPVFLPDATLCNQTAFHKGLCRDHARYLKPRVGLGFNLIVKNESNCLQHTLANIRHIADEIVVTDTGSTDDTVKIALKYAELVLFHKWQDSFSEARNWGLQYGTTDFLCWIDADETVINTEALKSTIAEHPDIPTFLCEMLSEMPDGRTAMHYLPKVFRRGTAKFEGIVHNQLIHQFPVLPTAVQFYHTGYNESPEIMQKKRARTIKLLYQQLENAPDDTVAMMNLARTLRNDGQIQAATEITERGLALETEPTAIRQMLLYGKILAHLDTDDIETAEHVLTEALTVNPHNVDFLYIKAHIALKKGCWTDVLLALAAYRSEKQNKQTDNDYANLLLDFWDIGVLEHEMLATAYLNIGQFAKARDALRDAIAIAPYRSAYWTDYIRCSLKLDDFTAAEAAEHEAQQRGLYG